MDDFDINFDSPQAIAEMKKRHLLIGLEMQRIGAAGLAELRERGALSAEECKELLDAGMKLEESATGPGRSRKRH